MQKAMIDKGEKIKEFCGWAEESDRFDILCLIEDNQKFVLEDKEAGDQIVVSVDEVATAPLGTIIQVIKGEKAPTPLRAYSRIVGYYSRISQWNNSKISELFNRAKGNYGSRDFAPNHQGQRLDSISKMKKEFGN